MKYPEKIVFSAVNNIQLKTTIFGLPISKVQSPSVMILFLVSNSQSRVKMVETVDGAIGGSDWM